MRWFRFYDEALDDPKVQQLSPELFRIWVNLLCISSRNSGRIPQISDTAFALRLRLATAKKAIAQLVKAGLIDEDSDGYFPHNWAGRQYRSDDVAERVRRYRDAKKGPKPNGSGNVTRNVTRGVTETPPDTDTDTETEEAIASSPLTPAARGGGGWPENGFELFLEAFAHRVDLGAAEREYRKIVGVIPFEELLAAARQHHQTETTTRRMNPSTWLARERWKDAPTLAPAHPSNKQQNSAWTRRLLKHAENAAAQRAGLNGGLTNYDPSHRPIQSPRARAVAALGYERASTPAADPGLAAVGHKPPQGS